MPGDKKEANYLIKTPFGLVGWYAIKGDIATEIDGLIYRGD